jgi:hypothetical protein
MTTLLSDPSNLMKPQKYQIILWRLSDQEEIDPIILANIEPDNNPKASYGFCNLVLHEKDGPMVVLRSSECPPKFGFTGSAYGIKKVN